MAGQETVGANMWYGRMAACAALAILLASARAETIRFQSFEGGSDNWGYTTDPAAFNTEGDPYVSGDEDVWDVIVEFTANLTNATDGTNFWGIEDLECPLGTDGWARVTFDSVNVATHHGVQATFDYDVIGYDIGDDIKYEFFFDTVSQGQILEVDGGGALTTNGTVAVNVPDSVGAVSLVVWVNQDGGPDYGLLDNFRITGLPAPTALPAAGTNIFSFTSAWQQVTGVTGYRLDVSDSGTFNSTSSVAYFNEIRANDSGGDDQEFIEIVATAGLDLENYRVDSYNGGEGGDGVLWSFTFPSFVVPDDGVTDTCGVPLGFAVLAQSGSGVANTDFTLPGDVENGPDGLILYDPSSNILDAVAWEAAGDLVTDDPGTVTTNGAATAANYLHVTVDDDADDDSLQAPDNVRGDDGSGWALAVATPGTANTNDSLQTSGSIVASVLLDDYVRGYQDRAVSGAATTNCAVTGLVANTTYYYRVRGTNATVTTPNSGAIPVTTLALPVPTALAPAHTNYNRFSARWTAVTEAAGCRLDVAVTNLFRDRGWNGMDDFDDGDFTNSPAWTGDTNFFTTLSDAALPSGAAATDGHFLGTDAGTGKVALVTASDETGEWCFSLGSTDFAPSDDNYFGVVLMANTNLAGDILSTNVVWQGYYLRVGNDLTPDPVRLYRKTGKHTSFVGNFYTPSYSANALQDGLNLRVTRSAGGVFELFYSTGFTWAGEPTTSAGTLTNSAYSSSSYFGVFSRFTDDPSGRRAYVDNIRLGYDFVSGWQDKAVSGTNDLVTGLAPETAYFFRVRATNGLSVSANSNTQTVHTPPIPPMGTLFKTGGN